MSVELAHDDASSVSIIVPARDEAPRLATAVATILTAARQQFGDIEIIIVDDASVDETPQIADGLAAEIGGVRVIHLTSVHGLGGAFKAGLRHATKEYVTVASGDGGTPVSELVKIWSRRGEADLIIPYVLNDHERPAHRLFLSRGFGFLVNLLFRTRVRYHMHFVLYRRTLIQSVPLRTDSYAFQAEALVKLLRRGHSFVEVGICDQYGEPGPTRSYELRNVLRVGGFFLMTLYDVYLAPTRAAVDREASA